MNARAALTCLAAVVAAGPCQAAVRYTKREKSELRQGPGNYYGLIEVLLKGSSVNGGKSEGGWVQVKTVDPKGKSGWLALNCLQEKAPPRSVMELKIKQGQTTGAAVAAAIRGFAENFGRAEPGDIKALEALKPPFFAPSDYQAFRARLSPAALPEPQRQKLAALATGYDPRISEEGVGLGIAASALAKHGLDEDAGLRAYVNMVATALGAASPAYDYAPRVYVVRAATPNAWAVPGGHILVTRGLVAACQDEAELAAALAHELTHVFGRHGLKEVEQRKTHITAESAMDELDQAAGGKRPEEAELEEMAEAAINAANKPRLAKYEFEADQGAALLLAAAGYDPRALTRMIERVGAAVVEERSGDMDLVFKKMDFKKRASEAEAFLKKELSNFKGELHAERFRAAVGR